MSIRKKLLNHFGIDEPIVLTASGWEKFHTKVKQEHPIAWFCIDTIPDKALRFWDIIIKPVRYLNNRFKHKFIYKYHIIKTGLSPGYADVDTRMINGMFNMLVDFVEIDKAMMQRIYSEEDPPKNFFQKLGKRLLGKKYRRNPDDGLKYIQWEMSLGNPSLGQAEAAREIWQIYHWWKFVRPARPDPMDASGWSAHCDSLRARGKGIYDMNALTQEEQHSSRITLDTCREIEEAYDLEDEQYLIRLVKIRRYLWN